MAKITKIIQSQDSDLPSEGKNFLQIDLTKKNHQLVGFMDDEIGLSPMR
jgi:hypothetical protein